MESKDKRNSFRHALLSETVKVVQDFREYHYNINDISEGGIFCKVGEHDKILAPNEFVHIIFSLPGDLGPLEVPGRITRVNWDRKKKKNYEPGFAVQFGPISEGNKKILDAFITYLRNKQIISVSKRIIEEFFGNMRSPK